MKITDHLYAYPWRGNDNNCNTYVFEGVLKDGRHIIVDPGHWITPAYQERGFERLFGEMKRDEIDGSKIGLVLLTHAHPDHCEAAIVLRQEYKALVALHAADEAMFQTMGGTVDLFLEEGEVRFESGKAGALQILHSPGHTPGHVTVYWPEKKVLIAGDCIFYRSTGRTDFPGGSAQDLRRTVERLAALDTEWLLCGHAYGNSGIMRGRDGIRENFSVIRNLLGAGTFQEISVEEERVKSAFELAMERISGMPELTPEEKAAQKEKEYAPLGTAIAVKYMGGMLEDSELPGALARYEGDALRIVRRGLVAALCGELQLDSNQGHVRRAWNGLEQVTAAKTDVLDSYAKIVNEFEAAKEKSLLEFGSAANESLKALGISGSAVRPNLNENEQWKQELERLRQSFEPKLEQLRQSL